MRKKWLLVILSVMIVGVTGCVETIELDEEQEDKFIQYSVFSVLEHDKNYLVNLEQIKLDPILDENAGYEEPTTEGTQQNEPATDSSGGNNNQSGSSGAVTVNNMSEAIGVAGVSFTYKGMKVCDSYPENDGTPAFVIKAVPGQKLVVLNFEMTNTTGAELKVDISSMDLYFKGVFNNTIKTNALVTLLPEALNTYISTIPAGGTVNTVLVYEMSDGYVNNLSEITIDVKSDKGTKSIKIQ